MKNRHRLFLGYVLIVPALVLFLLSLPLLQSWSMKSSYHGRWWDAPAPHWSVVEALSSSALQEHRLAELSGRFVWVYFGYLHCDGFCQQQWVTLFHLMQKIDHEQTAVLLVSIDPNRDTAPELASLATDLGVGFIPLVPDRLSQAQWLANQFHAPFYSTEASLATYKIQHAGDIFLVAPDGSIKLVYVGNNWRYDQLQEDYLQLKKQMQLSPF